VDASSSSEQSSFILLGLTLASMVLGIPYPLLLVWTEDSSLITVELSSLLLRMGQELMVEESSNEGVDTTEEPSLQIPIFV